jgi:hypothetical protein
MTSNHIRKLIRDNDISVTVCRDSNCEYPLNFSTFTPAKCNRCGGTCRNMTTDESELVIETGRQMGIDEFRQRFVS